MYEESENRTNPHPRQKYPLNAKTSNIQSNRTVQFQGIYLAPQIRHAKYYEIFLHTCTIIKLLLAARIVEKQIN